ncbi:MAG: hypothetical protein ACLTQI_03510 [Slackia sp.]
MNHEWGCTYKPEASCRFCMTYPDTYELGQANRRYASSAIASNAVEAWRRAGISSAADMCDLMRAEGVPHFP